MARRKAEQPQEKPQAGLSAEDRAKGQAVCDLIASGHTLAQACDANKTQRQRVWEWRKLDAEFDAYYKRAFEMRLDFIAEELLDIADDGRNDWIEIETAKGNTYVKLNDEAVRRSQLRIETRERILAVYRPDKYGKKLDVTSAGKPVTQLAAALIQMGDDLEVSVQQTAAH